MPRSSRPPGKKAQSSGPAGRSKASKPTVDETPKRPSVEVRVKPGQLPGSEVHEIEYESDPPPPAPAKPATRDPFPEHETTKQGLGLGDQVRLTMPTRPPPKGRGLRRVETQDLEKPTNPPPSSPPNLPPSVQPQMPEAWSEKVTPARGLRETHTGLGIPSPALGADTDFDPSAMNASVPPTRRTSPSQDIDLGLELGVHHDDEAPDSNDALDLVTRNPASSIVPPEPPTKTDPLSELRERYALGDFSGALAIAEGVLSNDADNADAQRYAESCRDVLRQMYAARLGPLDQVPVVAIPTEQLRWLTLDHRSGFLLSHVDGVSTLEEILDVSGMNPLEAMRIIYDLLQQKVIALQ